jgi:hypothetical protein
MMRLKILFFGLLVLIGRETCFSQEWIRIYRDSLLNTEVRDVAEHYDHGYIFSGSQYADGYISNGWLTKTNINGDTLWEKKIILDNKFVLLFGATQTDDGGIVEIGVTNKLSSTCYDPFIIKTNSCFEKEWCRIFDSPNCESDGLDIKNTPEGGYMALISRWKSGEENKIWLFRLDSLGDVIWAQVYATDPEWNSEWAYSILPTTDNCFVITGETYYPDPTYPTLKIIKIILIKVNLEGEVMFEVPWGMNNGIYSDGRLSVIDSRNNIYTAGRRARKSTPYGDSPTLFKTSETGQPGFYKDLKLTSSLGIATTINWFQDSTLVLCSQWQETSGIDTTGVIKTDSLGNIINQINFTDNFGIYQSNITFNNRLILGGTGYASGKFFGVSIKLTSDLEYDSVYSTPIIYDSLCTHPIKSDTITLNDCEVVVVGIDDPLQNPEKTTLKVYPNPAENSITVNLPQYLVKQSAGTGIHATTYYHQWKSVRLDIFDLFGKLMYSIDIPWKTNLAEIDISSWLAGMYVTRIVFMNEVVGVAKFLKE